MKRTINIVVENKFGVLARIAGLFSGRGFNIKSICAGETLNPKLSQMTVVAKGDDMIIEQIKKQLNKLINVVKVQDFTDNEHVERELVLIKVNLSVKSRAELMEIADIFRANIVDIAKNNATVELTGKEDKVKAFIELMQSFGIIEIARTGKLVIARG
jgi:acetolactate synthase-1/3 small subunit